MRIELCHTVRSAERRFVYKHTDTHGRPYSAEKAHCELVQKARVLVVYHSLCHTLLPVSAASLQLQFTVVPIGNTRARSVRSTLNSLLSIPMCRLYRSTEWPTYQRCSKGSKRSAFCRRSPRCLFAYLVHRSGCVDMFVPNVNKKGTHTHTSSTDQPLSFASSPLAQLVAPSSPAHPNVKPIFV